MTASAFSSRTMGHWPLILAAWLIALVSTLAALFLGEIVGQTPCNLCWFQRAFMFPLAVVLGVGCYGDDRTVWRYGLPLSVLGGLVAGYHSLLYMGALPTGLEPCSADASCSSANMLIAGYVPLPLLSFAAFSAIAALLLPLRKRISE